MRRAEPLVPVGVAGGQGSMGGMVGANADELDQVAVEVSAAAERLARGRVRIGRELHAAPWEGRSATAFRHRWEHEHARALASVSSFLEDAAGELRRNADQQRRASQGGGGGIGARSAGASIAGSNPLLELLQRVGAGDPFDELVDMAELGLLLLDVIELGELFVKARSFSEFLRLASSSGSAVASWGPTAALAAADFAMNWMRYGPDDARTVGSGVLGTGGMIALGAAAILKAPLALAGIAWFVGTSAGDWAGERLNAAGDRFVERATGSKEGWANSTWMIRNYGVASSEDLPPHVRTEAVERLNDHRSGVGGLFNMMVVDPIANQWWFASELASMSGAERAAVPGAMVDTARKGFGR